ncbi:hypothetical protein LPP1_g26 [Leptolyngbya phage LPP-1]|uniref:Uncharacterized protein n=1 Tax=Leptolyngbya phage LPP-1 TaxID=2996049 RepID=A0AAE9TF98_9CAUD|nr:hypothetical protein LPP1_g26 [Leptolyngbya phage LPP-1]
MSRVPDPKVAAMRKRIAELYRTTMMTQQEIAEALEIVPSAVNTAITMYIPMAERKELVRKRRVNARLKELRPICPHCGKPLNV